VPLAFCPLRGQCGLWRGAAFKECWLKAKISADLASLRERNETFNGVERDIKILSNATETPNRGIRTDRVTRDRHSPWWYSVVVRHGH
jgi:hypothetical protein